jgi:hypothetical protein
LCRQGNIEHSRLFVIEQKPAETVRATLPFCCCFHATWMDFADRLNQPEKAFLPSSFL